MSWAECVWTDRTLVCVASTGGPIAVCRDVTNSAVPIMIYNGAGESLGLAKVCGEPRSGQGLYGDIRAGQNMYRKTCTGRGMHRDSD